MSGDCGPSTRPASPPSDNSSSLSEVLPSEQIAIRLSNVGFKYGSVQVLDNLDLVVPKGAKVGLLGRSGCGKSTTLKIMGRVYQSREGGTVRYFERPANDVILDEECAFMEQSSTLFNGTIRDNISIGLEGTDVPHDDAAIKDACIRAQFWQDVPAMGGGKGLDAQVGYRGKFLSGGQAQRLCLARVLMRRTPILLLDEPVSAQDNVMVSAFAQELAELTYPPRHAAVGAKADEVPEEPVTVVATTHNVELMEHFTHAAMMLNGKVVEFGEKEALLARKGHYYRRMNSCTGLGVDARGRGRCSPDRLKQVWVFATCPYSTLKELATKLVTRVYVTDEELYVKGEDAAAMWFLASGTIVASDEDVSKDGNDNAGAFDGAAAETLDKFVYQAGDDFGVAGLIDRTYRWENTARVCSRKAVALELTQDDFEDAISADPTLNEYAGDLMRKVNAARAPLGLKLIWAFYGAPAASLEAVSWAFEPVVFVEDAVIVDGPMDPCNALYIVVHGKVAMLRGAITAATNGERSMETLRPGMRFGELEMLKLPAKGTFESVIFSKQSTVHRARAVGDVNILIVLSRTRLAMLMARDAALKATYLANQELWMRCIRPTALTMHWLLAACPADALATLAPCWRISVAPEGHQLVSDLTEDVCILVLEGSVEVMVARPDGEYSLTVGSGVLINALALVRHPDHKRRSSQMPYNEKVVRAEASVATMILTLTVEDFEAALAKSVLSLQKKGIMDTVDPLAAVQSLAEARARLLDSQQLHGRHGILHSLLPSALDLSHAKILAQNATDVLLRAEEVLFSGRSGATGGRLWSRELHPGILGGAASAAAGATGRAACLYVVVHGALHVVKLNGDKAVVTQGQTLCSDMPKSLGEIPAAVVCCLEAQAGAEACVLVSLSVGDLADQMEKAKRDQEEAERNRRGQGQREKLKQQCAALAAKIRRLELRLGLRKERNMRHLWQWAGWRVRVFMAFRRVCSPSGDSGVIGSRQAGTAAQDGAGSLEEHLAVLQGKLLDIDPLVYSRSQELAQIAFQWDALQPIVFSEEAAIQMDSDPFDLSLARIAGAKKSLDALQEIRTAQRNYMLELLEKTWEEDSSTRDNILNKAPGIDHASFKVLSDACTNLSGVLAPKMKELQAQLEALWTEMRITEAVRAPRRWQAGMPLEPPMLDAASDEIARLESCAVKLRPHIGRLGRDSDKDVAGEIVSAALTIMEQRERKLEAEMHSTALSKSWASSIRARLEASRKGREAREHHLKLDARISELEQIIDESKKSDEQPQRTSRFVPLVSRREMLLEQASECLTMLCADEATRTTFLVNTHGRPLPDPALCTEADIRSLKDNVNALQSSVERLQNRCNTDGLLVALRSVAKRKQVNVEAMVRAMIDDGELEFTKGMKVTSIARVQLRAEPALESKKKETIATSANLVVLDVAEAGSTSRALVAYEGKEGEPLGWCSAKTKNGDRLLEVKRGSGGTGFTRVLSLLQLKSYLMKNGTQHLLALRPCPFHISPI